MLEYRNIRKFFEVDGGLLPVVESFSTTVREGDLVVLLGPSGCGKSTLLRVTASLDRPSHGEVLINGKPPDIHTHRLGFVFQEPALLPWRTLLHNVTLGLEIRRVPRAEREQRAMELLRILGLEGFERYYPHRVSGGMKHRAAIARAYIVDPLILLMDEPFVALDAQTRETLQGDLLKLWERMKKTILFVTHNLEEAIILGTRILVLSKRPATIIADREVRIPYPRDPLSREFITLRQEFREQLT